MFIEPVLQPENDIRLRPIQRLCNCLRFTLIEMLVVISIIVIIASMLLPSLISSVESSRQIVCANNQRQLFLALSNYENDASCLPPGSYAPGGPYWYNHVLAGKYIDLDIDKLLLNRSSTILSCPSPSVNDCSCWIGYNVSMCLSIASGNYIRGPRFTEFSAPTKTAILTDSRRGVWLYPTYWKFGNGLPGDIWKGSDMNAVDLRHNEGAVYSFADGHTKYLINPDFDRQNGDLETVAR